MSILANSSNLTQRIIAGVIGGALLIGGIYASQWSFFAIFFIINVLSLWEFYGLLLGAGAKPMRIYGTVVGAGLFAGIFFSDMLSVEFVLLPILMLTFIIKLYDKNDPNPFQSIAYTFLGILYVAFPYCMMIVIAFSANHNEETGLIHHKYHYQVVLGTLFLLWASDTGAYFAGKNFGKTKLFERISPKKTWEGTIGGAVLSLAVAYVISLFFKDLRLWEWLIISLIMVIIGSLGDLVESMLKRSINVKDSGSLIPGHGGLLDRFDGLLIAAPFVATFLILIEKFGW